MTRRIDRETVQLSAKTIELPWASRTWLVDGMMDNESMRSIVKAFEDIGTSRAVTLTSEQKGDLVGWIEGRAEPPGGWDGLPEGVYDLRCALRDELGDAWEQA